MMVSWGPGEGVCVCVCVHVVRRGREGMESHGGK